MLAQGRTAPILAALRLFLHLCGISFNPEPDEAASPCVPGNVSPMSGGRRTAKRRRTRVPGKMVAVYSSRSQKGCPMRRTDLPGRLTARPRCSLSLDDGGSDVENSSAL